MRTIVVIALTLALFGCDSVTSRYDMIEEARADGLFERGWLPDVLPDSANSIRAKNQLDTNWSEGEFSFLPSDADKLFDKLSEGAPPVSRLGDWDETVSRYTSRGYSAWSYHDEESTWAFFCQGPLGRCEYIMWLR